MISATPDELHHLMTETAPGYLIFDQEQRQLPGYFEHLSDARCWKHRQTNIPDFSQDKSLPPGAVNPLVLLPPNVIEGCVCGRLALRAPRKNGGN